MEAMFVACVSRGNRRMPTQAAETEAGTLREMSWQSTGVRIAECMLALALKARPRVHRQSPCLRPRKPGAPMGWAADQHRPCGPRSQQHPVQPQISLITHGNMSGT
jgi:hypothetical protein